ncbi:MAG: BrnA antitoxin family protein [Elusimicrobiota bacterium]|jgi:predicted DNA binding CopG/RHH family protein|nr:BrnA antitoxin family protein [Elusimicrobiota bacterium]
MRKEYDFSKASANPYTAKLRRQISIRLDMKAIEYFKEQAQKTGIPYQKLINLYLTECAATNKTLKLSWK